MTSLMEQREQLARDRYQIDRVMAETIVAEPETPAEEERDPRVQRGVEWLDQHVPDWANLIKLKTFDIGNSSQCVLGQIYQEEMDPYGYALGKHDLEPIDEHTLGFNIYDSLDLDLHEERPLTSSKEEWDALNNSWKQAIKERQKLTAS